MLFEIKLTVIVSCMVLKWLGETLEHNFQRYVLPLVYAVGVSFVSHTWWLGLTVLPMIGALVLGYKDYGSKDSVARALWLFVICCVAALGPFLTHHLAWYVFFPYIVTAGFVGTLTRNINNLIEAPIGGLWIGLPILFIH